MKLPQNLRCSRGLLEPDAWKAGTSGSEGAPAQQCVGATRRFTFSPRYARSKSNKKFNSFLPAASDKAVKRLGKELRQFRLHLQTGKTISELARYYNPVISGWINYYGRFYKSRLGQLLRRINFYLIRWAMRKYKRLKRRVDAWNYLSQVATREPKLWAHWAAGVRPGLSVQ